MSNDNAEYIDVMLDLETLGVRPGCKILQISACTFNLPPNTPRESFDIYTSRHLQAGLYENPDTLKWWMEQDASVRDKVFNPSNEHYLIDALDEFSDWLEGLDTKVRLWGNGVRFDNAILEYAYNLYDIKLPWDTKNERCYRTLKAIFKDKIIEPAFEGYRHNALHDAIHQANYAEYILKYVGTL